jgi:hypothetical protein
MWKGGGVMNFNEIINTIAESSPSDWLYDDDLGLYVYTEDVDITILSDRDWPNDNGFDEESRFHGTWAEQFPDSNAYRRRFFIRYRGVVISAFYTALVDGARCYIPYPNSQSLSITKEQYGIGYIINSLPARYDFDQYLRRAGITVQ